MDRTYSYRSVNSAVSPPPASSSRRLQPPLSTSATPMHGGPMRRQKSIGGPMSPQQPHHHFSFDSVSTSSRTAKLTPQQQQPPPPQTFSPLSSPSSHRWRAGPQHSLDSGGVNNLQYHQTLSPFPQQPHAKTPSPSYSNKLQKQLSPFSNKVSKFLQVQSPSRSGLPHQLSGESTESARSCLSATSQASGVSCDYSGPTDNPTSEMTYDSNKGSPDKLGLWPSIKKMLKEKKKPLFKKRKTEVEEIYVDPVYHLLRCGANPDHKPETCYCDCHSKSEHL